MDMGGTAVHAKTKTNTNLLELSLPNMFVKMKVESDQGIANCVCVSQFQVGFSSSHIHATRMMNIMDGKQALTNNNMQLSGKNDDAVLGHEFVIHLHGVDAAKHPFEVLLVELLHTTGLSHLALGHLLGFFGCDLHELEPLWVVWVFPDLERTHAHQLLSFRF